MSSATAVRKSPPNRVGLIARSRNTPMTLAQANIEGVVFWWSSE